VGKQKSEVRSQNAEARSQNAEVKRTSKARDNDAREK
jgi:hypothetical protein